MPLWSLTKPPKYVPNAIATREGWVDPRTGELLVAIGALDTRHGGAEITRVRLINYKPTFSAGEILIFEMNFNEAVDFTLNDEDVPFLQIFVGDDELQVPYVSGRGTGTWRFEKTIPLGVGGQITMPDPASLFIDGTLADVDGQGDPVDFEYTPPSPLPTVNVVYPQLNAPTFVGIISHSQDEGTAVTPGRWIDFEVQFSWPILDVVGTFDEQTYLLCRSNGEQFSARLSSWNEDLLNFTYYLPNSAVYNDEDGIEYLSLNISDQVQVVTVTGTYTNVIYDMSGVPIGNPNVNIEVDPVLITDVTVSPMEITEPGDIDITITFEANITGVVGPENIQLQYRSGQSGASCDYVSHTGTTMTFRGPVISSLFNNTGLAPFYLFALDVLPGGQIVTTQGTLLKPFILDYFDVDPEPDINIPS